MDTYQRFENEEDDGKNGVALKGRPHAVSIDEDLYPESEEPVKAGRNSAMSTLSFQGVGEDTKATVEFASDPGGDRYDPKTPLE